MALASPAVSAQPAEAAVEVTVRAERPLLVASERAPTAASSVLSGERLERAGDSSADVLRQVPGVQVRRTGSSAEAATATLRGTDSWATPVYLAGILLNDEVSGTADLSTIPLWMVQRVEVFRGNAPFGAERLGLSGAIFFEPKRATRPRLGASAELGSFGERGAWLMAQTGGDRASALVAVRRHQAEGDSSFLNDHGQRFVVNETLQQRENADHVLHDAWSVGELQLSNGGRLLFVMNALDREQGTSGVATTPSRFARAQRRRLLSGVSAQLPCRLGEDCSLNAQSSVLVENTTLTDPRRELRTLRSLWLHNQGQRSVHNLRLQLRPVASWKLGLASSYANEQLRLDRLNATGRRAKRRAASFSVDSSLTPFAGLLAYGLLGVQCRHTSGEYENLGSQTWNTSSRCVESAPEARLGAALTLSEHFTLLSNASHSVRVPTLGELYGTSPFVTGNPETREESSLNVDLGVRGAWTAGQVALAVDSFAFARVARDLVRYRRTSLNAFTAYNVGRARVLGVETALGSRWFEHLETQTALTWLDPRETSRSEVGLDNDVLPLTSRLVASQSLRLGSDVPWLRIHRATLGLRYFYASNKFADSAGLAVLPEQHLWDLDAELAWRKPELKLRASIDNLLDARSLDLVGLPLPSRAYHASVEAWW